MLSIRCMMLYMESKHTIVTRSNGAEILDINQLYHLIVIHSQRIDDSTRNVSINV